MAGKETIDEASLLAAAAHVDLNPIRVALAETSETSEFAGAKDRLDDLLARKTASRDTYASERSRLRRKSGWLNPVEIDERSDPAGADVNTDGRRAGQKEFLPISLTTYLKRV